MSAPELLWTGYCHMGQEWPEGWAGAQGRALAWHMRPWVCPQHHRDTGGLKARCPSALQRKIQKGCPGGPWWHAQRPVT